MTAARLLRALALGLVLIGAAAAVEADQEYCVLRVSGALVYLDAGTRHGVQEGDTFVVLAPQGATAVAGEVRVVRVLSEYAIAEVVFTEPGRQIEVLQRVIPRARWDRLPHPEVAVAPPPEGPVPAPVSPAGRTRFVQLLAGGDWGRRASLDWNWRGRLVAARRGAAASVAIRLGTGLTRRWRAALTYRLAVGGEVTQLGAEADLQFLMRANGRVRPYAAIGGGLHHLDRTVPDQQDDSANRVGANLLLGLELSGPWRLSIEGGYQRVARWEDPIDLSHLRTYAGIGREF